MFEIFRKLFRRKKKEEAVMEEKQEFVLKADEDLKETEVPSSRYTEEYAEFVERTDAAAAVSRVSEAEEEKLLEEEMLADPFADVAAQDADVEVPEIEEVKEEKKEPALEEQMLEDPFADVAAQDEDPS